MTIQNFKEIRRDGKVIDESMTLEYMLGLGWTPNIISKVQWDNNSQPVELSSKYGVKAKVTPTRDAIVALESLDEKSMNTCLSIINADGTLRCKIPNTQLIRGRNESGRFVWFEPARSNLKNCFGAVFTVDPDNLLFQIDIDENNGGVVGTYPIR